MIITENGIEYIVKGDYPDGKYVKHIKNKGAKEEKTVITAEMIYEELLNIKTELEKLKVK